MKLLGITIVLCGHLKQLDHLIQYNKQKMSRIVYGHWVTALKSYI